MKRIGLTHRLMVEEHHGEVRDALDVRWTTWCRELPAVPAPIPTRYPADAVIDEFGLDGLVLTGGNDLSSFTDDPLSRERDAFESALLRAAMRRSLPVLAVCRGMQLIGSVGGTPLETVDKHIAVRHPLDVDPEARFGDLLDSVDDVNSFHQYALAAVPDGFAAVARTPDGVIEAIVHERLPVFAQMWHPERDDPPADADLRIARELFGLGDEEVSS